MSLKVLITGGGSGGHVSPSLAVSEQLRLQMPDVQLLYVGGTMTMQGSTGLSVEQKLVGQTDIPLQTIRSGKLRREGFGLSTITRLWGALPGLMDAWKIVRRYEPDVVFSSGGYVSLPVVVAAWIRGVPIVIHEQTAAVGLTNSISSKMAKKVAITFPQSAQYFNSSKVVLTGNPIQQAIVSPDKEAMSQSQLGLWLNQPGPPIVFVTGGGLGSHTINQAVADALPQLLTHYRVVHQCGAHEKFNDFDTLSQLAVDHNLREHYWLQKHYSAPEMGWIYSQSALVVARAGANTVLELAAWALPSIFIPIPWVTHDEQTKNAQTLVSAGTAIILPEAELSPARLSALINERIAIKDTLGEAKIKAKQLVDPHAREKLTQLVFDVAARKA